MNRQAILVCGAAGFIGFHTASKLLKSGHRVVCIDSFTDAYDPAVKRYRWGLLNGNLNCTLIEGDIGNAALLDRIAGEFGPFQAVINLAARAGVRESLNDPISYFQANTIAVIAVLEFCKRHGIKKFVLASTSSVYGEGAPLPTPETSDSDHPLQPYSASKKAAEVTAHAYYKHYGIDVTILRFFTVYGPAGRPDMSIFRIVRWVTEGEPVIVFGDGTQSRGFTYVADVADGVIGSLKLSGHQIINLGGHEVISINTLIRKVEDLSGCKAIVERRASLPAEISTSHADVSLAAQLLGWRPKVSLEEGIRATIAWYREEREWASRLDLRV